MHFDGQIGYVRSAIAHFWRGRQSDRGYTTRWKLLVDNDFDPDTDLTRSRDEDATELDRAGHAKI